jgi:G:T-mismatch repair DNA endonuclease (very short patch repair protein)
MRSRGIGLDAILTTLREPSTEYRAAFILEVAGDRWIAERRFDFGTARIVYEESRSEIFVVTCMWVRNSEVQD